MVALESSPEHPQPLRVIARAVRGWVERLGAVWVEAQLIEINRRSGTRTIFLTLRDKLAEVSSVGDRLTDDAGFGRAADRGRDRGGAHQTNVFRKFGPLHLSCDAITPVGEGRLLARLEQTKRLLKPKGSSTRR